MTIREAIQEISGFRYMTEELDICSAPGRRCLYETEWIGRREQLEAELSRIEAMKGYMEEEGMQARLENVRGRLMQIRDIRGTIGHLGEDKVLDDLELFELKHFALLAEEIGEEIKEWTFVRLPGLSSVVKLLDPEGNRIPHFYIYDAYSPALSEVRAEMKKKKQQGAGEEETEQLYFRSVELEDEVREHLSRQLCPYREVLAETLKQIGELDVVMAKAAQAKAMRLCRPCVQEGKMWLNGLVNPAVQAALRQEEKDFQSVDVEVLPQATLITGANMAGKTVLLKSVALAQCLLQFGFYIPAEQAEMVMVDGIFTSIGDEQDELSGLSSFAAEMLRMNKMVELVKAGKTILVLIDELARTTNPVEGRAIVNGVVDFLTEHRVRALVTTHYSGIVARCRKLRVKGFIEEKVKGKVTLKNLSEFIDYSLEEEQGDEVPHEAMRIAALLGVDGGLLERTAYFLEPGGSATKHDSTDNR